MQTRYSEPIIFFGVWSAITIGAGCIGAPIVLADYKEDDCVRCASPLFIPIAYKLSFTNGKRKYVEEKMKATYKNKQTLIATVRYHILTVARHLIPLIFCYPLPLRTNLNAGCKSYPVLIWLVKEIKEDISSPVSSRHTQPRIVRWRVFWLLLCVHQEKWLKRLKGTVSWDYCFRFFFMYHLPPSHRK